MWICPAFSMWIKFISLAHSSGESWSLGWPTQGFHCVFKWFIDKCFLLHFTAVNLMLCNYHLTMRHSYFGSVKTSLILLSLVLHRSQLKAHVFHILIKTLRRQTMISISQRVKKNFVSCNAKCFEFCWMSGPKKYPKDTNKVEKTLKLITYKYT